MEEENKPKKVIPIVIEGFEINAQNVTYQKLQEFSLRLYEKLLNVRKERNFLMLERDKYRTILKNCRHQINETKNIGDSNETELEQAKGRFQQDLKEVDQEVKYILYDHNIKLNELQQLEKTVLLENAKKNLAEELELLQEKRRLKVELMNKGERNGEELKTLQIQLQEEIISLVKKLEEVQIQNDMDFKKGLHKMVVNMILKHEMEMSESEERKNSHIVQLKEIHKDRLNEIKYHFNSITAENLTLISSLKQSLDVMKKSKNTMVEEVKELKREGKRIKEPLERTKLEVKKLTRQLVNYEKDLLSLKNNKHLLRKTLAETKQIKKDSLSTKRAIKNNENYNAIENLNQSCLFSMNTFENCSIHMREQLEELVKIMILDLELKQSAVKELTDDPDINESLREINFEYWNPKKLSFELATVCKAHDELLAALQQKLEEFCIPKEELKFTPSAVTYVSTNPIGLISKQLVRAEFDP